MNAIRIWTGTPNLFPSLSSVQVLFAIKYCFFYNLVMRYYLHVLTILGKRVRTTKKYWEYIVKKHESVKGLENKVKGTLENPEYVRLSKEDKQVYLYYSKYNEYYLCIVCKHLNNHGFIITAYLTDKIKKGDNIL